MCIRDRHIGATETQIARHRRHEADFLAVTLEHEQLAVAGAVSYTHLRAHETVLDLVCRLLLDKKKKHKTNSYNSYHTIIVTQQPNIYTSHTQYYIL